MTEEQKRKLLEKRLMVFLRKKFEDEFRAKMDARDASPEIREKVKPLLEHFFSLGAIFGSEFVVNATLERRE